MLRFMRKLCTAVSCVCLLASGSIAAETAPSATVSGGEIKGVLEGGEAVFRAFLRRTSCRRLRWREPQAVVSWNGVRDATEFGQPAARAAPMRESEDCLTLNIWTPNGSATRQAVMV
jgi:para-nitrobenzyl esterase